MRRYTDVPFTIGVQTKRGCVLKCIHCSDRYLLGENLRLRNPGVVVDEIEQLVKESGVKTLIFVIKAKLVLGKNFILHNLLMTRPIRIYPHAEIKEIAIKEGIIDKNLDLVEPVFYNPPPLKYMVSLLRIFSRLVWWMRERLKRRVTP